MSSNAPVPSPSKDTALIRKLGIETLGGRYRADCKIGHSFGGSAFSGIDILTGSKVFMKYLICPRGENERAKFMMEHDALRNLIRFPINDVAPKVLHFEEFDEMQTLALVTDWVEGELLSTWLERAGQVSVQERLAVFHRVAIAMSMVTKNYQHRDFHPGNIMMRPDRLTCMAPEVNPIDMRPGVTVLDWGEALPVIMCNYDDEPDHNFLLLAQAPRMIGGAFTSLPPEIFRPWTRNNHFGGTYESWGLGMLLYRVLTLQTLRASIGIGDYALKVHNGTIKDLVKQGACELGAIGLPGGLVLPRLFKWMMEEDPAKRANISDIARVMYDLRYEALSISDNGELEKYFTNPYDYEPASGWRFSYFPDFD